MLTVIKQKRPGQASAAMKYHLNNVEERILKTIDNDNAVTGGY